MEKILSALVILFFLVSHTRAQDKPEAKFYIRGKAMSMVAIEDNWFSTISLGTEYRFSKRFSIVIDAVHYSRKFEREVPKNNDASDYDEYAQRDRRNYLVLELKYHFIRFENWNNSSLYFNIYSKVGEHRIRTEGNYPLKENERFHLNGNFVDPGISLGIMMNFTPNFGMDINLGVCHRFEKHSYWKTDEAMNAFYFPQQPYNQFLPNIRLNFFWTFKPLLLNFLKSSYLSLI